MAEVLGLITAIGSIASAGLKVVKTIYSLADELGTAGVRVKALGTDARSITWALRQLKLRMEKAKSVPVEGVEVTHETATSIQNELDAINEILKPLTSEGGKKMSKSQKAKWIFTKSQLETHRVALDSLKASLNLILNTLTSIEGLEDR